MYCLSENETRSTTAITSQGTTNFTFNFINMSSPVNTLASATTLLFFGLQCFLLHFRVYLYTGNIRKGGNIFSAAEMQRWVVMWSLAVFFLLNTCCPLPPNTLALGTSLKPVSSKLNIWKLKTICTFSSCLIMQGVFHKNSMYIWHYM